MPSCAHSLLFFFFNDTATTEIYTLSLHDALPIFLGRQALVGRLGDLVRGGSGASDPAGIPALISAAIRTALFALLFMGSVLVYIPYLLASGGATGGWHFGAGRYPRLVPLGAGIAGIALGLRRFPVVGRGTPAPFDPPRELVATGLYRWVRNPMYLSALLLLVGEATLLAARVLFL